MSAMLKQMLPSYEESSPTPPQQVAKRLERGQLIVARNGWGLHVCGAAYDVEVFAAQKAYEVTAKVFMAMELYDSFEAGRRVSCGWDDPEAGKIDFSRDYFSRDFHDVRSPRIMDIQKVEWLRTDQYGDRFPRPDIGGYYLEIRKRFDIEDGKPMRRTIPMCLWAKETPPGLKGRFVKWWRHMYPKTKLLKDISQRITQEIRPDIIALVKSRLGERGE